MRERGLWLDGIAQRAHHPRREIHGKGFTRALTGRITSR